MSESRKQRDDDVERRIRELLRKQDWFYVETEHAAKRMRELRIVREEVLYVLRNGTHDAQHDTFSREKDSWKYAICGKTLDGDRELRVIVSIAPIPPTEDEYVIVITLIDLNE